MNDQGSFDLNSPFNLISFIKRLFVASDFMPHGHCYFWRPDVLWLNVISDAVIALAYYSIPLVLIYFVIKRKDFPFHWMFLMFGAFIFLCGTTHLISIVTTWMPVYRFEGVVKLVTAIVSITTAILLIPLMPRAVALPSSETVINELSVKRDQLEKINKELEKFNRIAMGREDRIISLKHEINALSKELGRNSPYEIVE